MDNFGRYLAFCALILRLPVVPSANERPSDTSDSLAVILHSASLADQREALKAILDNSQKLRSAYSAAPARLSPVVTD